MAPEVMAQREAMVEVAALLAEAMAEAAALLLEAMVELGAAEVLARVGR